MLGIIRLEYETSTKVAAHPTVTRSVVQTRQAKNVKIVFMATAVPVPSLPRCSGDQDLRGRWSNMLVAS